MHARIQEKKYHNFVPFYVWVDTMCRMVRTAIQEKEILEQMDVIDDKIDSINHEKARIKLILAHLNCDPDAGEDNYEMA